MLVQRLRHWPNIKTSLVQWLAIAMTYLFSVKTAVKDKCANILRQHSHSSFSPPDLLSRHQTNLRLVFCGSGREDNFPFRLIPSWVHSLSGIHHGVQPTPVHNNFTVSPNGKFVIYAAWKEAKKPRNELGYFYNVHLNMDDKQCIKYGR